MVFPEEEYYSLEQAAQRWGVAQSKVQNAIVTGNLVASVCLRPMLAYKIFEEPHEKSNSPIPHVLDGYVRVAPESCRLAFFHGKFEQRKFVLNKDNCCYVIVESLEESKLQVSDLVILTEDVHQFEKQHNGFVQNSYQPICRDKDPTRASLLSDQDFRQENDCRHVTWNGYCFTFGETQAHIFRQLLIARDTDKSWVHGKRLLANAHSSAMVLRDVFRHQPHWKEVIHSNGRGYYRLNPALRP